MSFPQTPITLIQRLADGGSEEDWRVFHADYWGAVCRFSLRWGARNISDAEDVSSQTFAALWENRLLVRWMSNRSAKLRTLLCCVTRNILSQRNRVQSNRDRLFRKMLDGLEREEQHANGHIDAFYSAWVEDILQRALESLATEYYREGKGNHIRVFYGRICQRHTIAQMADVLQISTSSVDHYFRHVRDRLAERLEETVRQHVSHYSPTEETEHEFTVEWQRLGQYLAEHGGLEEAVRQAYDLLDPVQAMGNENRGLNGATARLSSMIQASSDASGSENTA